MRSVVLFLIAGLCLPGASPAERAAREVRVPLNTSGEVDVGELVGRLAGAAGVEVARPSGALGLPARGLGGALTRRMLADSLGPEAAVSLGDRALIVTLDPALLGPERRPEFGRRLAGLARAAEQEAQRRRRYGMHALASFRPNDPGRPTVCLVHGLNSSSGGFVHMIPPLEAAGYGLVVYDYPFNRDLGESSARFARDWAAFRRETGEARPWAILAHSMGALVARSYVEGPEYAGDVASLILIAPVNRGSSLAKHQTMMQMFGGLQAINGKDSADALAQLGDGLGEAAEDMLPGSAFLEALNRRPRRAGVPYHILAGDVGFLRPEGRRRIEARVGVVTRDRGLLGGLARMAVPDLPAQLDELSDGTGDGCVSVAHSRLEGVTDHVVIHANHAELIRAPLLFRDPGPVACMPDVLRWLARDVRR